MLIMSCKKMKFYKRQLSQKQQLFCDELFNALKLFKERAKAPNGLSFDEVTECVTAVKYDYPELFYVNYSEGLYYTYHDHVEYQPKYHYSKDETQQKIVALDILCKKVISTFKYGSVTGLYKKVLWIHNMFVRNCDYDHEAIKDNSKYQAYTLEGPLFDHCGVCQGIAMAFKYLCDKCCGTQMIIARGRSLEPGQTQYERHAWNIIVFGENAAHIDVTWDMCITESKRPVRYDYFFLSDLEMMRDHHYINYPMCRTTGYSFFEQTKTQFNNQLELRLCLTHRIQDYFQKKEHGALCFSFKIKNRRETKEELNECVKKAIQSTTSRNFQYSWVCNEAQSVFSFWIEFL